MNAPVRSSQIPYPTCARCNMPVLQLRIERDVLRQGLQISVWCHGKRDECFLSDEYVDNFLAHACSVTVRAFEGPLQFAIKGPEQ